MNKEILQFASKCGEHQTETSSGGCSGCINYTPFYYDNGQLKGGCQIKLKDIAAAALAYREMLEKVQFLEYKNKTNSDLYTFCPVCENPDVLGHKKDCKLLLLLNSNK